MASHRQPPRTMPASDHTLNCLCPRCVEITERTRLRAYFKGLSQGRKEAAILAAILGLAYLLIQVLRNLQSA